MNKKVFFIDRDGVIDRMVKNKSEGFDSPQKPSDVKLVKGIVEVIKWANLHKILVIEITNQPGVAKGKMDMETLELIEKRVHELLKESGAVIDKVYCCLHHPQGVVKRLTMECDCRKPKPGLLLQAARELDIDLSKSIFLGDNASDAEAGKNAGCKTILYLHEDNLPGKKEKAKKANADYRVGITKEIIPILKQFFAT